MTKAEEEVIRAIIRDEISSFFHHVAVERAHVDDTSAGNTQTPEGLLRLLFLSARDRYFKTGLPFKDRSGDE